MRIKYVLVSWFMRVYEGFEFIYVHIFKRVRVFACVCMSSWEFFFGEICESTFSKEVGNASVCVVDTYTCICMSVGWFFPWMCRQRRNGV